MSINHTCPRCGHQVPNDQAPGAHIGALSRTDNKTEICSACGTEEGLSQFADPKQGMAAQTEWPLSPVLPR